MELRGWLAEYADPDVRDEHPSAALGGAGALAEESDREGRGPPRRCRRARRARSRRHARQGLARRSARSTPSERSRALDLLGFEAQLVFSTFAPTQFVGERPRLAVRRHPRAQPGDRRLLRRRPAPAAGGYRAVGPARAHDRRPSRRRSTSACAAILVPSVPARDGNSPTHPDYHPFWAHARRTRRAVRAAHRWRWSADSPGVPRQRHPGHRLPRRRREHPRQGLHRRSRTCPRCSSPR